jgi:hypothetical protein
MGRGSLSEDPVTNLANNAQAVIEKAETAQAKAAVEKATATAALQRHTADQPPSGDLSGGAAPPPPNDIGLDVSAPNVLGTSNRTRLAVVTQAIASIAVVSAVVVLFATQNTERIALLLIGLAGLCVVVAYLTTMGFGSVKFQYGPPRAGAGSPDPTAK